MSSRDRNLLSENLTLSHLDIKYYIVSCLQFQIKVRFERGMQPAMFCFCLNFRISLGSRQSSTTSSGQTSHRASNLWAAANLSGPGQTPACNSSSTLPDYNGGHRQNSKPVADGGSGPPAGGLGQDPACTLSMPTAASKMQGNSVSSLF